MQKRVSETKLFPGEADIQNHSKYVSVGSREELIGKYWHDDWKITEAHLEGTGLLKDDSIDWKDWERCSSSILFPRKPAVGGGSTSSTSHWQPEEKLMYIRSPVVVNLPSFACLLGQEYTGKDILAAWDAPPVVKAGKKHRGT